MSALMSSSGPLFSSLVSSTATSTTTSGPPPPPPPDPMFVLRGHRVAVQCVRFVWGDDGSLMIVSGDSTGLIHLWSLTTRRSVMTWQAHDAQGVLHVDVLYEQHGWKSTFPGHQGTVIVTQGKDGFLTYWSLSLLLSHRPASTGTSTSTSTPPSTRSHVPLAAIHTQSYTFCRAHHISHVTLQQLVAKSTKTNTTTTPSPSPSTSAASKSGLGQALAAKAITSTSTQQQPQQVSTSPPSTYAAIPGDTSSNVHVWDIVTRTRVATIDCGASASTHQHPHVHIEDEDDCDTECTGSTNYGMVMAVKWVCYHDIIYLVVGMESGHIQIWNVTRKHKVMEHHVHQQPILSVDMVLDGCSGVTCSAEATVVKFTIDYENCGITCAPITLPHEGVSDVRIRTTDHALFATAGWDKRVRLFSYKSLKPLAVLQFHTDTVYGIDFVYAKDEVATATASASASADTIDAANTPSTVATLPSESQRGLMITSSKDGRIAVYDVYGAKGPGSATNLCHALVSPNMT